MLGEVWLQLGVLLMWVTAQNGGIAQPRPALSRPAYPGSHRIALAAAAPGDAYPHIYVSFDTGVSWTAIDDAAAGTAMASNIMGLEWDAFHPTLYVSTGGRSVAEVHF